MACLHGKFVWFEHFSNDIPKARAFYGELFGWKSDPIPMGESSYHMILNGQDGTYYVLTQDGVPRGGLMKSPMPDMPSAWLPYVSVKDCDASLARAQSLGAAIRMAPMNIPDVGRFTVLTDPLGAAIGIVRGNNTV